MNNKLNSTRTNKKENMNKEMNITKEIIYIDCEPDIITMDKMDKMDKMDTDNKKRKLTENEKEYICDFLPIDPTLDFDVAMHVMQNIRTDIMDQLKEVEIYPSLIDELKNTIVQQYYKSQIQPGQMVGVDSATSLGEPTTQMTLNSFHSAGKTCAAVTTGVPRFRELLDASKQQKHTLITFTLNKEPKDINEAKYICKLFDEKRLYSLLTDTIPLIYNTTNTSINNNDKYWYDYFTSFINNRYTSYKWYMRLNINIDILYEYKLTLKQISNKIEKDLPSCTCVYSPDNIGIIDVYIKTNGINMEDIVNFRKQIDNVKKTDKKRNTFIDEDNKDYYYIRDIVYQYICNIKISGVENIEKSYFRKLDSGPNKNKWFFELEGTNYIDIMNNPNIDYKNCMVNNMWEIYNTLGIEAVRKFLIAEFNEIITSGGINVDKVHLEILADSMTCTGSITSVSRYGIGRNETGPLTKASFEQSLDNMLIAAYRAEVESIKSVSSSVILGQCSKIGTGMMELYNKIV